MKLASKANLAVGGLVCAWMMTAGSGFLIWGTYHATPGDPGAPRSAWPSSSRVALDRDRPTLLIFLNPRCPCSMASLAELGRLVERYPRRFAAHAIVHRSADADADADPGRGAGPIESSLAAIPGLRRWDDPDGIEADRLGVKTSGHVLLYDPSGRLLFSGGITIGRGQEGENPGLDRLGASIQVGAAESRENPVFGCSVPDLVGTSSQEPNR